MTRPPCTAGGAPRRLKELSAPDAAAIVATDPRLIIPVGTCEQHGPHLPFGCATIIADRLTDDLSAITGVLRAPTLEYGVNMPADRDFPGNGSMRRKTLHRVLNDLLASWEISGFREFILITAHDHDAHQEALDTVITRWARVRVVDIYTVRVADLLDGQLEHMHGGEVDTSLMLYLAPDLVDLSRATDFVAPPGARPYRRGAMRLPGTGGGSLGRPSLATAEKGKAIYERIRDRIVERIFYAAPPDA